MLREALKQRDDIAERWLDEALSAYSAQAIAAWRREKDAFANPVGHALREGIRALLAWFLDRTDAEAARAGLDRILQIRAVQGHSASEAVSFLFRLKGVVRAELGNSVEDPGVAREVAEFEARIDEMGLVAFDLYTAHRERLCELRVAELKRTIPWSVARMQVSSAEKEPV